MSSPPIIACGESSTTITVLQGNTRFPHPSRQSPSWGNGRCARESTNHNPRTTVAALALHQSPSRKTRSIMTLPTNHRLRKMVAVQWPVPTVLAKRSLCKAPTNHRPGQRSMPIPATNHRLRITVAVQRPKSTTVLVKWSLLYNAPNQSSS